MLQKKMEDLHLLFNLEFHVTVNKKGIETQKKIITEGDKSVCLQQIQ